MSKKLPDKLHLGCGGLAPEGWLNTDGSWHTWLARHPLLRRLAIIVHAMPSEHSKNPWPKEIMLLDVRKELPFSDEFFRAVYASHVLEHLHYVEAFYLLKEVHRVLKTKGIIRIVVPDLQTHVRRYINGFTSPRAPAPTPADTFIKQLNMYSQDRSRGSFLNRLYHIVKGYNSHKWMYDETSLKELFKSAGFSKSRRCKILHSDIDDIQLIERPERLGNENSLIIEDRKD